MLPLMLPMPRQASKHKGTCSLSPQEACPSPLVIPVSRGPGHKPALLRVSKSNG